MRCPVDNETLVMADRNGVEIDYCPKCRGVWLDRGELDKIIERSVPTAAPVPPQQPAPAPQYAQPQHRPERRDDRDDRGDHRDPRDYRDDDYHDDRRDGRRPRKRESFLSDLFDF